MKIPILTELLQKPTMFILGAGSSAEYGFPVWCQLKEEYLRLLNDRSTVYGSHAGAEYWIQVLENDADATVDQIASDAPGAALHLFQSMTFDILLEREALDLESDIRGWIEIFGEKFSQCLDSAKTNPDAVSRTTGSLNFCSLNYERCFPHRFARTVDDYIESSFQSPVKRKHTFGTIQNNCRKLYQPHGTLGPEGIGAGFFRFGIEGSHHLFSGKRWRTDYGDVSKMTKCKHGSSAVIMPVGLLPFGNQNYAYKVLNSLLKTMQNVVIVGLSDAGMKGSDLEISANSRVYCTGKDELVPGAVVLNMNARELAEAL